MRAIDSIINATRDKRSSIEVPEWGLPPLYFGPLTTADMDTVAERLKAEDGIDGEHKAREYDRRIALLVLKAEYEDGTRVFEWGDRLALRDHAEWSVMQRVIAKMYSSLIPPGKDAKETMQNAKN